MRGLDPHVVPERFNGIELWAVLGQRNQVKAMAVTSQPRLDLGCPMVSRVVVDQEDFLPRIALRQPVEENGVASAFKHLAPAVMEAGAVEVDCPKDLLRVALARRGNQRLLSAARPSLVEARVLTETGFIGEEQRRVARGGVFFSRGYV